MTETLKHSNQPAHTIYHVKKIDDDNAIWNKQGVAWMNKDGKGLNLNLSFLGLEIELVVRENLPEPKAKLNQPNLYNLNNHDIQILRGVPYAFLSFFLNFFVSI